MRFPKETRKSRCRFSNNKRSRCCVAVFCQNEQRPAVSCCISVYLVCEKKKIVSEFSSRNHARTMAEFSVSIPRGTYFSIYCKIIYPIKTLQSFDQMSNCDIWCDTNSVLRRFTPTKVTWQDRRSHCSHSHYTQMSIGKYSNILTRVLRLRHYIKSGPKATFLEQYKLHHTVTPPEIPFPVDMVSTSDVGMRILGIAFAFLYFSSLRSLFVFLLFRSLTSG